MKSLNAHLRLIYARRLLAFTAAPKSVRFHFLSFFSVQKLTTISTETADYNGIPRPRHIGQLRTIERTSFGRWLQGPLPVCWMLRAREKTYSCTRDRHFVVEDCVFRLDHVVSSIVDYRQSLLDWFCSFFVFICKLLQRLTLMVHYQPLTIEQTSFGSCPQGLLPVCWMLHAREKTYS